MYISLAIMFGWLALAIVMTVLAESMPERRLKLGFDFAWAALFCFYGVCVGIVSMLVQYAFDVGALWALAIGLPLGFPVLIFLGKASEG